MKYIAPNKKLEFFTCPHCNTLCSHKKQVISFDYDLIYAPNQSYYKSTTYILKCSCCSKKIIWIDDDFIYPEIQQEEPNPDMPETVLALYKEAGLIYTKSPRAACALLRLAIDKLCNELGETDKDINKNIAGLVKKGLSIKIKKALDIVRVIGNKAVHPGEIAFDVDDIETARLLFNLINKIVDGLITEPKELDGLFDKLPQSVKDSIDKRDTIKN